MHSFARFCYPLFTASLYRESRATKVIHGITVPSLFGEFYEIFHMKTREHVRSATSWYGAVFFGYFVLIFVYARMAAFVTHAMEERWKWQWFYSIMASSFGLQLSVTLRSKYAAGP